MSKIKSELKLPQDYKDIIHPNMKIKNYKELCKLMRWTPTTGNSKKAQINEFERICEYRKEGHSYNILSVFEEPLEAQEVDYARNMKYSEDVKALLIALAKVSKGDYVTVTNRRLYTALGFGNNKYYDASGKTYEEKVLMAKELNVNKNNYIEFIDSVGSSARSAVETAIKGLMKLRIIRNHKYTFAICTVGENGLKYERLATPDEHNMIYDIEYKCYTKLGYRSIREALFGSKFEYEQLVKEMMTEHVDENYLYHYSYHYFDFNKSIIEDAYLRHEIGDKILKLNERFKQEHYKKLERRSSKASNVIDDAYDLLNDEEKMLESIYTDEISGKSSKRIRDASKAIRRGDGDYLKEMAVLSDLFIPISKSELNSTIFNEVWR